MFSRFESKRSDGITFLFVKQSIARVSSPLKRRNNTFRSFVLTPKRQQNPNNKKLLKFLLQVNIWGYLRLFGIKRMGRNGIGLSGNPKIQDMATATTIFGCSRIVESNNAALFPQCIELHVFLLHKSIGCKTLQLCFSIYAAAEENTCNFWLYCPILVSQLNACRD